MSKALTGFFKTRTEGEAAQEALLSSGFLREEVGFLAGATHAHETPAIGPVLRYAGSQSEAARDTWLGAMAGLAVGLVAVLPDVGLMVAAGPLAGMIGGLAIGGAVGGLFGLLKDHGVSEAEAEFYAEGVRDGGSLVTVHGVTEIRAKQARKILDHSGAIQVERLADEPSEPGTESGAEPAGKTYNSVGEDIRP
jgi:hypothetical protein